MIGLWVSSICSDWWIVVLCCFNEVMAFSSPWRPFRKCWWRCLFPVFPDYVFSSLWTSFLYHCPKVNSTPEAAFLMNYLGTFCNLRRNKYPILALPKSSHLLSPGFVPVKSWLFHHTLKEHWSHFTLSIFYFSKYSMIVIICSIWHHVCTLSIIVHALSVLIHRLQATILA